jgi:hypothetical protein
LTRVFPGTSVALQVAGQGNALLYETSMTTILPPRVLRELKTRSAPLPQAQALLAPTNQLFTPGVQEELAQSDHEAWTAVCTILITIVSLGLVLGIGTVLLTL